MVSVVAGPLYNLQYECNSQVFNFSRVHPEFLKSYRTDR